MPAETKSPNTKQFLSFWLAAITVGVFSLASGIAYGWLDGRWVAPADLRPVVDGLSELPESVGDWGLLKKDTLSENIVNTLRCYGYCNRTYVNVKTGTQVTVAVLFGPRGPIAVHTPEICYSSAGVTPKGPRKPVTVEANNLNHTVWQLELMSKMDGSPSLEVHYAWSDGNQWFASEHPRFWPANKLFKIQLASSPTPPGQASESIEFLKVFFPSIQEIISKSK